MNVDAFVILSATKDLLCGTCADNRSFTSFRMTPI